MRGAARARTGAAGPSRLQGAADSARRPGRHPRPGGSSTGGLAAGRTATGRSRPAPRARPSSTSTIRAQPRAWSPSSTGSAARAARPPAACTTTAPASHAVDRPDRLRRTARPRVLRRLPAERAPVRQSVCVAARAGRAAAGRPGRDPVDGRPAARHRRDADPGPRRSSKGKAGTTSCSTSRSGWSAPGCSTPRSWKRICGWRSGSGAHRRRRPSRERWVPSRLGRSAHVSLGGKRTPGDSTRPETGHMTQEDGNGEDGDEAAAVRRNTTTEHARRLRLVNGGGVPERVTRIGATRPRPDHRRISSGDDEWARTTSVRPRARHAPCTASQD